MRNYLQSLIDWATNKILNPKDRIKFTNPFKVEHFRNGVLLATLAVLNTVTTDGKNNLFNIMFNSATQITTWYIGLMDNASYSANPVTDTMSSHSGWIEWQSYSESVRQTWGSGSASSGSVTNGTAATFTMNASGTLKGIFVTSVSTKGGTTGVLWSSVVFGSTVAVASGDQIKITYTVSA